ncbi:MAG: patatin-like phospholipase family protein [Acidobacteriota bacterium]|nr:patatin-like phospholipase family protein [Acidobacteriota bacterium]
MKDAHSTRAGTAALVLTGGGARAAYQVGLLRCLVRHMPEAPLPIITGVSAGAINAVHLAAHKGSLREAVDDLTGLWAHLEPGSIYRAGGVALSGNMLRWGLRLLSGGSRHGPKVESLLDSEPLRGTLEQALATVDGEVQGIDENLTDGDLQAIALSTLNYTTSSTVTWVQGRGFESWERPRRRGVATRITIDHIMASAALPLVFPAIRLGDSYFGDGGVRLSTPLAPAIHLGADRILAISTRYRKSREESRAALVTGYPPPVQVAGNLMNAIFLDAIDQDARNLKRINQLVRACPDAALGLRPIKILVLRPSIDLGQLAAEYEPKLPRAFRFLSRGLGTRQTRSPDFLSMLMFQPDYLTRLIEIGEADAEAQKHEILELLTGD